MEDFYSVVGRQMCYCLQLEIVCIVTMYVVVVSCIAIIKKNSKYKIWL